MRRLILIRHAEAVQSASLADRDRSLSPSGLEQAHELSTWIGKIMHPTPNDLAVIASPAVRTRQTAQGLVDARQGALIVYDDRLYNAREETILDVVHARSEPVTTLAIVGHNPALNQIARRVASRQPSRTAASQLMRSGVEPANACVLLTANPWCSLAWEDCTLNLFFQPTKN